ncbi:MAG: hypothetical protein IJD07_01175 [Clostridia bacterium]|nr:hypothetical protein [Clostridia bacterium]
MKGLIGFGFFLLLFAYTVLTATVSYFCFTVAIWLGIVAIIVMAAICVMIIFKIKRKFEYYNDLAKQTQQNSNQPTEK